MFKVACQSSAVELCRNAATVLLQYININRHTYENMMYNNTIVPMVIFVLIFRSVSDIKLYRIIILYAT